MMRIRVEYFGQLRDRAGCAEEVVQLPVGATLEALLSDLAQRHNLPVRSAPGDNPLAPNVISINDTMINDRFDRPLADGDAVTVLAPIAGG